MKSTGTAFIAKNPTTEDMARGVSVVFVLVCVTTVTENRLAS